MRCLQDDLDAAIARPARTMPFGAHGPLSTSPGSTTRPGAVGGAWPGFHLSTRSIISAKTVASWTVWKKDPLPRFQKKLLAMGMLTADDIATLEAEVKGELEDATREALAMPSLSYDEYVRDAVVDVL